MKMDLRQDDHFFFDVGRQGKFFILILFVYFFLFGVIAWSFNRLIGHQLIWLFSAFPRVDQWIFGPFLEAIQPGLSSNWLFIGIIPILIIFLSCFILTYKEDVYLYGFKFAFWLVPFIIFNSIFWYSFVNFWLPRTDWLEVYTPANPFYLFFGTWQGWVTILLLFVVTFAGAFVGWQVKEMVRIYIRKEEPTLKNAQKGTEGGKIKNLDVGLHESN